MAVQNFTGDQQKTLEDINCPPDLYTGLQLQFFSGLNSFLSVTAFLENALILAALHKESSPSLHPPSKLLLRSLATTDLCVGLITQPLKVIYWMSVVNEQWNICRYAITAHFTTGFILCGVSVSTMTAISVDRLLALLLGLRYRQVVTLERTYVIVIALWLSSTVVSAMAFWNSYIPLWFGTIGILLCVVISIFSYTKIFFTLRHHQNQVQQPNQTNQLNIARYKKAVSTAIWLQLALVACYLPYCVVAAWATNQSEPSLSLSYAWTSAVTLVLLNSSLNPILYCWRLEEVRQTVKDIIRHLLCYCFSNFM